MSPNIFGSAQEGVITAIVYELTPPRAPVQHCGESAVAGGAKCRHTFVTSGLEDWSFSVAQSDLFSSDFTGFMMSPKRISLTSTTGPGEETGAGSILPLQMTKTMQGKI